MKIQKQTKKKEMSWPIFPPSLCKEWGMCSFPKKNSLCKKREEFLEKRDILYIRHHPICAGKGEGIHPLQ